MRELRCDAALRKRLSEAGLARARGKYHQTLVIAQLEELYQDVARAARKALASRRRCAGHWSFCSGHS